MIKLHRYEGKNLEILKEECLKELEVKEEEVFFYDESQEGGLFKGKKIILEAFTHNEIKEHIKSFIVEFAKQMNMEINSEIRIEGNSISVLLVSSNNNILIGKEGKNLEALQLVLRQSIYELKKFNLSLILDIGNYRGKKVKNLEYEIKKICKEVLKSKLEVKLDPMNSFERRIVHTVVSEFDDLQSNSIGEEPNRYTVIKIKD